MTTPSEPIFDQARERARTLMAAAPPVDPVAGA
jgi:hypothetical protein